MNQIKSWVCSQRESALRKSTKLSTDIESLSLLQEQVRESRCQFLDVLTRHYRQGAYVPRMFLRRSLESLQNNCRLIYLVLMYRLLRVRISLGNAFLNDGLKNCCCHKAVSKSTTCSEVFEGDQLPHQQCRFSPQSGQFVPISSVSSEGRCKRCNSTVCQKGLCQ